VRTHFLFIKCLSYCILCARCHKFQFECERMDGEKREYKIIEKNAFIFACIGALSWNSSDSMNFFFISSCAIDIATAIPSTTIVHVSLFCFFLLQIIDDHYHMEHRSIAKRSISASHHHQRRLNEDNRVAWSEQQRAKSRQKRDFTRLKPKSISKLMNDPKWSSMWYLNVSILLMKKTLRGAICRWCMHAIYVCEMYFNSTTWQLSSKKYHSQLNCSHLLITTSAISEYLQPCSPNGATHTHRHSEWEAAHCTKCEATTRMRNRIFL
jgi:hypothetical protein